MEDTLTQNAGRRDTRLGELLVAQGVLSADQLRIALLEQEKSGTRIGRLLVDLGFVSEAALKEALSENQGTASIDLAQTVADAAALARVPRHLAKRHRVLPLAHDAERQVLTLAAADAHDLAGLDRIRAQVGLETRLEIFLAGESEIDEAIDRYYGYELSIDGILKELETGAVDGRKPDARGGEYSQPVVRLIDALLTDAVKQEASDIHFEPEKSFLRIRYRQDGILRQIRALHHACWPAMAVRLKVMSGMNIAETRAPQDGRVTLSISGRPVDFRVASQPTLYGENIVLRVLDRQKGIVPLEKLGLAQAHLQALERMLLRPDGIVLVTGPTGSGKTTTLYSVLNRINSEHIHIMTLEDPVEYPMPLVRQTSVNEAVKLDFANGVRSMMRQDPDVILVGEIRDAPTAEMAFRAAMTGHRVFATLHTASALGAIPRLLDVGVTPEILSGNVAGVIAQRLVRRLCPHCRIPAETDVSAARLLGLAEGETARVFRAKGCAACRFLGYRGRFAIMELLFVDRELDDLIADHAPRRELLRHARRQGFRAMAEDGVDRVLAGETTLEELLRVVDLSDRLPPAGTSCATPTPP
ncbi:MAG: GspE/PulE family protein [Zoogloeaceae bacterium]|jgi:general secretion pathway protein E/type IV pilus assembly protein PilB|nr:GspE/PulE family protein [Zoogloeaceae bacterium]